MNEWDGFKADIKRVRIKRKKVRFWNLDSNTILSFQENGVGKTKMRWTRKINEIKTKEDYSNMQTKK